MNENLSRDQGTPARKYRVLVVDHDHDELVVGKAALQSTDCVEIVGETTSYALVGSLVNRHQPDFIFLAGLHGDAEFFPQLEKIRKRAPASRIVLVGEQPDADEILRAFRAGADEYLVKPMHKEELRQVFERLRITAAPEPVVAPKGKVIGWLGSRGGCGATVLASNLAQILAPQQPVALVDFHFNHGDMGVYFDVRPELSLADMGEAGERLDATLVNSLITRHKSGVNLLLQPFDQAMPAPPLEHLAQLLLILRAEYEYVLVDFGTDLSLACAMIPGLYRLVLVARQDLPSLHLAQRALQRLEENGMDAANLLILLNAFSRSNSVTSHHAARMLGRSEFYTVRQDDRTVQAAINRGVSLREISRWSKAKKDMDRFAEILLEGPAENHPEARQEMEALRLRPLPLAKSIPQIVTGC